jgi:hypothetical protein
MTHSLNNDLHFTQLLMDDHAVLDNVVIFNESELICSTKKYVI